MGISVDFGKYRITLINNQCVGGQQTFVYQVELISSIGNNISNFALALCDESIHNVIAFSLGGDANTALQPCFDTFNPQPLQQIKFNIDPNQVAIGPVTVFFTLDDCFQIADIDIAFHAGEGQICTFGKILGPTCDVAPPPPGRGVNINSIETFV